MVAYLFCLVIALFYAVHYLMNGILSKPNHSEIEKGAKEKKIVVQLLHDFEKNIILNH